MAYKPKTMTAFSYVNAKGSLNRTPIWTAFSFVNEFLVKANIRCIQYVILHELTHLLYPNHSKDFYDFLTIQMPDWQERKKELDKEVVQGLS